MYKIIVINYGSQYNELIARRIRELGVYSSLVRNTITSQEIVADKSIKGIILSGGPNSIYDVDSPKIDKTILSLGIPILGICYGMQLVVSELGGCVNKSDKKEYGKTEVSFDKSSNICKNLKLKSICRMSHGDSVSKIPEGFTRIASSKNTEYAAIENVDKNIYLLQFHPEVTQTEEGAKILENFINTTGAKHERTIEDFAKKKIDEIRQIVKSDRVLLGISGGVDSSVTATLLHKAIGNNLSCVFVDHGLLRKDEAKQVMDSFEKKLKIPVHYVNASSLFLTRLEGVSDPEEKRKIIGKTFIEVFYNEGKKLGNFKFLSQGTLYTDKVESGANSTLIKSHHNVGGLPKDLKFTLIEPLDMLFKDEVRRLGTVLRMDEYLINRQPFPGPGLSIRIIGEVTSDKIKIVQEADAILLQEVKEAGLARDIWQYFCVLTNIKSVGVMGDQRSYLYTIAIRAVTSIDGMTADFYKMPYDVLSKVSSRIVNEVPGVNRVVYDITSKPPATIEYE
ncbi:MAG: glutamine-hydrolyzing GMP synthase [Erysipelotrichaceae bacterium]|nr:glutamine-hydrolyzing GMP synthase [Erysipelotrichaceae bacterium]MCB9499748.1 glutamine-hydrolyzing GMP synthase [Erysipelotrichaceae bacterium]